VGDRRRRKGTILRWEDVLEAKLWGKTNWSLGEISYLVGTRGKKLKSKVYRGS